VENLPDVDAVLTTRELAVMIKRAGLIWDNLPQEKFDDDLLGEYTGAGAIFGVTGGVMEAALRTAYHTLNGKEHDPIEFTAVRGFANVKEAEVDMGKVGKVKVAVTSGMANAKPLLDQVRAGKSPYAFIEIMCCPGGCINGGGQPFVKPSLPHQWRRSILDTYRQKRATFSIRSMRRRASVSPTITRISSVFIRIILANMVRKKPKSCCIRLMSKIGNNSR
jgi:NADP-reducing hydrogenase subunit HndD